MEMHADHQGWHVTCKAMLLQWGENAKDHVTFHELLQMQVGKKLCLYEFTELNSCLLVPSRSPGHEIYLY